MLDIDHLKEVNDEVGHQAEDEVLKELGKILKTQVRSSDIPGRWGGEEFLLVCPETDIEGATRLAEELRAEYRETPLPAL